MGIDYGMGQVNINKETGIRYGVIPVMNLQQEWPDSMESDYGPPTCGKCGNEAELYDEEKYGEYKDQHRVKDYACANCERVFESEDAFSEEVISWDLDNEEYRLWIGSDCIDMFVMRSPYYTHAEFCSPCAPGACYLLSPNPDAPKAYCLGRDWFDDEKAPYPIFLVADGSQVLSESEEIERSQADVID